MTDKTTNISLYDSICNALDRKLDKQSIFIDHANKTIKISKELDIYHIRIQTRNGNSDYDSTNHVSSLSSFLKYCLLKEELLEVLKILFIDDEEDNE